jgi:hypothetical protein
MSARTAESTSVRQAEIEVEMSSSFCGKKALHFDEEEAIWDAK